ncbi:unnamed protein product [Rhizophagus irregularis]|nr:unnamed protein product [Rhizophagus irregularis]
MEGEVMEDKVMEREVIEGEIVKMEVMEMEEVVVEKVVMEVNAIQILSDDDFEATSEKSAIETKLKEKSKSRINSRQQQNIHESVDDNEESHQSRQQDNITFLLQVTDSDDSDCDDDNTGINEDSGNNEDIVSSRRIGKPEALSDKTNVFKVWLVLEKLDILATANQICDAMNGSLDSSTASVTSKLPAAPNSAIEDKVLSLIFTLCHT